MKDAVHFNIRVGLPPEWRTVEHVNQAVQCYSKALFRDTEIAEAVSMVCAELLENAIKYSDAGGEGRGSRIRLRIAGDAVSVRVDVANAAKAAPQHAAALSKAIAKIRQAESTAQAYMDRMQEVFDGATSAGGLGLVRIAHEGGCELDCAVNPDGEVEVRATFRHMGLATAQSIAGATQSFAQTASAGGIALA